MARRPLSAQRSGGAPKLSAGDKVEYYSKSYDEWIPAHVGFIRTDGNIKLLHEDGSVLKEQADPSLVRLHSPGNKPPRPSGAPVKRSASNAGAVSPPDKRNPAPTPRPAAKAGRAPSPAPDRANYGRSPSGLDGIRGLRVDAGNVNGVGDDPLSSTINPRKFYPGDRVKIKDSGREGVCLFIGTPSFAGKEQVGMCLDEKRSKSECDGKGPNNERLFRCTVGHGIFLPSEDVELLPRETAQLFPSVVTPDEPLDLNAAFSQLVGLNTVKQQIIKIRQIVEVQKKREGLGVHGGKPLYFTFRGGRGTGMSSVAKLIAHLLRDLHVLATGQLVEVSRKEVINGCSNHGEAEKQMSKVWKASVGGVLLVNDAHQLQDRERTRDEQGVEVSEYLAKQLDILAKKSSGEDPGSVWPQSVCVILTTPCDGQLPDAIKNFAGHMIEFADYSIEELADIFVKLVEKRKFTLTSTIKAEHLQMHVRNASNRSLAGERNVGMLSALVDEAIARQTERVWSTETVSLSGLTTLAEQDFVDTFAPTREESMRSALAKLDGVIGLRGVKSFIHSLYAQLKTEMERREAGINVPGGVGTLHMVFTGNPGTGKTTVARIVAELLSAMGLLRKGHLVEADRGTLVAGYSGQTALKTRQVVEQAMGGVLFVDEAYALVSEDGKDSFGHEALDTLIKMIEDRRQDLVVILAGYPDEMQRLIASNPGIRSRFPVQVQFEDYNEEELMQIAEKMLLDDVMVLSHGATQALARLLNKSCNNGTSGREHGNGRAVRNILEMAKRRMAVRLQQEDAQPSGKRRSQAELCTLEAADLCG